ncbi:phage tail terminator-like protein [Roseibacterium sp. SDUM158017]|uniref:phage tail terminator-like protein n=1 Tax=Roseicyclus salinarum TaxID=3036773 RepID=UPI002414DBA9|nr:phage tail terminator-like protein [Roseibacterium sp. SDUM158017]MDG4650114.1 phage tail terminator-like protein [Roseibacterium sp. SDUM158017]
MTEIAQIDIHRALLARVDALSMSPMPVVLWPGFPAMQADYWLRVTHLPNIPDRIGVNASSPLRHSGILQLDLMNELGRHEVVYIDRAQDIIDHFPQDLVLTQGAARITVLRSYAIGGRSTGDHWMIPIRVNYAVTSA